MTLPSDQSSSLGQTITRGPALGWFWVAFYSDWSEFTIFEEEIDALRYAVEYGPMRVVRVPTRADVRKYVADKDKPPT